MVFQFASLLDTSSGWFSEGLALTGLVSSGLCSEAEVGG